MQLKHTLDRVIFTAEDFLQGYFSVTLVIVTWHPLKIVLILFELGRVDRKFLFVAEVLCACQTLKLPRSSKPEPYQHALMSIIDGQL